MSQGNDIPTAAEAAKLKGWRSLKQAAERRRVSTETMRRWYKSNPRLFNAAIAGGPDNA